MKRDEIIHALQSTGPLHGGEPLPGPDCPDTHALAAWLEGTQAVFSPSAPANTEDLCSALDEHLADCPFCSFQLALIRRGQTEEATASVPVELLHKASRLIESAPDLIPAQTSTQKRQPEWLPWATAAVLVLIVGLSAYRQTAPITDSVGTAPAQTRYASQIALNPQVLSPVAGSQVQLAELVVRWSEVPGSLFYDVNLVDAEGELLLRERVQGNRWLMPENLGLQPGAEYYIRVDAWLNEAKFLSSEHIAFSVGTDE